MNIAFLARTLNLTDGGGSNFSLNEIATELVNRGHSVHVYATHEIKTPSNTNYKCTKIQSYNPHDSLLKRFRWISNFCSTQLERYDVAHIFNPAFLSPIGYSLNKNETTTKYVGRLNTYTLICSNTAKMNGQCHRNCGVTDKIAHANKNHTSNLKRLPRYLTQTYIEPKYASNIDILFAISPQIKQIYKEYGYKNDIRVVPNFCEDLPSVNRDHLECDKPKLLYVGRLEPQKGVDILLQSINSVEIPVHVDIVGSGSQTERLKLLSDEISDHSIAFHDYIPHEKIGEFYSQADLFIHPALWPEPFGRTVLEALQYDCPVLVSNVGAPPWIAGSAGETFKRGDATSLANKINQLLRSNDKMNEMRDQCPNRVNQFSKEKVVDKVERLYNL